MVIEQAVEATEELFLALQNLVPQLAAEKTAPTRAELATLIESKASSLLIARYPDENSEIVGVLTLAMYRVPTGIRSIVEDVIVDERFRRKGIAKALMSRAIDLAREGGANSLSLTSNSKRREANLLYQGMGFQRRETNLYMYTLK